MKLTYNPIFTPDAAGTQLDSTTEFHPRRSKEAGQDVEAAHAWQGYRRMLLEATTRLDPSNTIVKELNKIAIKLRQAFNQDPFNKRRNIALCSEFEVIVIDSKTEVCFILPKDPSKCYMSTGWIVRQENINKLAADIAHEQAHAAILVWQKSESRSRSKLLLKPCKERYGECIWENPLKAELFAKQQDSVREALLSKSQELWCDLSSQYYINFSGIDPRFVVSSLVQHQISATSNERVLVRVGDLFDRLVRRHPPDQERISESAYVVNKFGFPAVLASTNLDQSLGLIDINPKELKKIYPPELKRMAQLLSKLYRKTKYFETFVGSIIYLIDEVHESNNASVFPFVPTYKEALSESAKLAQANPLMVGLNLAMLLPSFSHSDNKMNLRIAMLPTFAALSSFQLGQVKDQVVTEAMLEKFEHILKTNSPKKGGKKGVRSIDVRFRNYLESNYESSPVLPKFKDGNQIEWINNLIAKTDILYAGNPTVLRLFYTAIKNQIVKVLPRELESSKLAGGIHQAIMKNTSGSNVKFPLHSVALDILVPESNMLSILELAFESVGNDHLKLVRTRCVECAPYRDTKGELTFSELFDQLECWATESLKKISCIGVVINEVTKFRMLVSHLLLCDRSENEKIKALQEMKCRGYEIGVPYATLKTNPIRMEPELVSLSEQLHMNASKELKNEFRKIYPQFFDIGLTKRVKKTSHSIAQLEQNQMVEPISLQNGKLSYQYDQSKFWMNTQQHTLAEILAEIKNRNLIPGPAIWLNNIVPRIDDIEALDEVIRFVNVHYSSNNNLETPLLEYARVDIGFKVAVASIQKLISSGSLNFNSENNFEIIEQIIRMLPRCSKRNPLIEKVIDEVAKINVNQTWTLRHIQNLTQLIETEPYDVMIDELVQQVKEKGSEELHKLEATIESSELLIIEEKYLGTSYDLPIKSRKYRPGSNISADQALAIHYVPVAPQILQSYANCLISPNFARYETLRLLKINLAIPSNPISLKSEGILAAERIANSLRKILGLSDPLNSDLFDASPTVADFYKHLNQIIIALQPTPTPLRDSWIEFAIESFYKSGGILRPKELRKLQSEIFSPAIQNKIGARIWTQVKQKSIWNTECLARLRYVDYLGIIMPIATEGRNTALRELRQLIGLCSYDIDREFLALHCDPRLPSLLPSKATFGSSTLVEFLHLSLQLTSDYEIVDLILTWYGAPGSEKPWIEDYLSFLFGGDISGLRNSFTQLSEEEHHLFVHRLFGGRDGIFARNDQSALKLLAKRISEDISNKLNVSEESRKLILALSYDLVFKAQLPIPIRAEILSRLLSWNNLVGSGEEVTANLLIKIAEAIPGGLIILQNLVPLPALFPENIQKELRSVQDSTPESLYTTPHHHIMAGYGKSLPIGPRRGGGTKGEVFSIGGGRVVKTTRLDLLRQAYTVSESIKSIADTVQRHGRNLTRQWIADTLEQWRLEIGTLQEEANKSGLNAATVISDLLEAPLNTNDSRYSELVVSLGSEQVPLVIPNVLRLKGFQQSSGMNFAFFMSDLGQDFKTLATLNRIKKQHNFELETDGSYSLANLADTILLLFVKGFLKGKLFGDLHMGNVGHIKGLKKAALLDYGTTIDFPIKYTNWILRFVSHVMSKNQAALIQDLIEISLMAGHSGREVSIVAKNVKDLVETAINKISNQTNLNNAMPAVSSCLEFLATSWPMPKELRHFTHALRKCALEWLPLVSDSGKTKLASILMSAVLFRNQEAEGAKLDNKYQRDLDYIQKLLHTSYCYEEENWLSSDTDEAQAWLREFAGDSLNVGDLIIVYTDQKGWVRYKVTKSSQFSSPYFTSGNLACYWKYLPTKGFIEFSGDDANPQRISLPRFLKFRNETY